MFEIHIPAVEFSSDLEWVISQIFSEFLGLEYCLVESDNAYYEIFNNGKKLTIEYSFSFSSDDWLRSSSLPPLDLKYIKISSIPWKASLYCDDTPVLYGNDRIEIESEPYIGIDIFGSIYFMLSMYDECMCDQLDSYSRVDSRSTFLYKEKLYSRPIVNEYIEILWGAISYLWPDSKRKQRSFKTVVTCDVDRLYECESTSCFWLVRRLLLNIQRCISIKDSLSLIRRYLTHTPIINDRYYKDLLWLSEQNEKVGNSVIFYFISGSSSLLMDTCYKIEDQRVSELLIDIHKNGHKIGIHPSYNTSVSQKNLNSEVASLKSKLQGLNINYPIHLSRQHYLRWHHSTTPHLLNKSGVKKDSTLGYPFNPGFRTGTCYEYELFDPVNHVATGIFESPLILMDVALFSSAVHVENYDEKYLYIEQEAKKYKEICNFYQGNFVLLWHNNQLITDDYKQLYLKLINNGEY